MRHLILLALIVGCENEAITYAHSLEPDAQCHALNTQWMVWDADDTATCVVGRQVWLCRVNPKHTPPECRTVHTRAEVEDAPTMTAR